MSFSESPNFTIIEFNLLPVTQPTVWLRTGFGSSAVEVLIIIIRRGKWGTGLTQCLRAATQPAP